MAVGRARAGGAGGILWLITPRVLIEAMAADGAEAKRAFNAMVPMKKIEVAKIGKARGGDLRRILRKSAAF